MQKKRMNNSLITGAIALSLLSVSVLGAKSLFSRYAVPTSTADTIDTTFNFASMVVSSAVEPDSYQKAVTSATSKADIAMQLYNSDVGHDDVVFFYTKITGSSELAQIILDNAGKNSIQVSLAFSLAWEESRYQPRAVNRNSASIDRGLFQLNSKSFPKLTERDFFNPNISAYYGLSHLNVCMEQAGNEIAALAMYNAGANKIRNNCTPQRTLNYISRITSYRDRLENLFRSEIAIRYHVAPDGSVIPVLGSAVSRAD